MRSLPLFAGLAVIVTLTPGPATVLVLRSALRGGRRAAFLTTLGNSIGVLFWGAASAAGIAALVAASQVAFVVLKVGGAIVLIALGVQSWRRGAAAPVRRQTGRAFRDGIVTAIANPKLAVFFIALFPQFLRGGHSALGVGLAMASFIVALDLVWFSTLALLVTRVRDGLLRSRWPQRLERLSGSILVGLGLRLALETR